MYVCISSSVYHKNRLLFHFAFNNLISLKDCSFMTEKQNLQLIVQLTEAQDSFLSL